MYFISCCYLAHAQVLNSLDWSPLADSSPGSTIRTEGIQPPRGDQSCCSQFPTQCSSLIFFFFFFLSPKSLKMTYSPILYKNAQLLSTLYAPHHIYPVKRHMIFLAINILSETRRQYQSRL